MNRRKIREQAFFLVFEKSFTGYEIPEIVSLAMESRDLEDNAEATATAQGVFDNITEIDSIIDRHLKTWSRNRLSRVSLSILRLAVYEMKYVDSLEHGVSINEAVEMAKKFSVSQEASFINGVLGGYQRECEAAQ
ncbi:MAG: transcription antitermination factor NusB [Oscillospiraceae bacterium]|nr:transcription antitermination factor NusB [Oscillospiraceae bacterium]